MNHEKGSMTTIALTPFAAGLPFAAGSSIAGKAKPTAGKTKEDK
jgi:hypothetical protein